MAQLHISLSAEPIAYIGQIPITNSMFTSLLASLTIITIALIAHSQLKDTRRPSGLQNILEMIIEAYYNLVHDITHSVQKTALIFPVCLTFFLFILLNNWAGLLPGVGTIGLDHEPGPKAITTQIIPPVLATESTPPSQISLTESESESATPLSPDDQSQAESSGHAFVPVFRAGSADLNTTIALALISMVTVQFLGFKFLGLHYLAKFFNFKNAIFTFVGILELVSEFAKVISFAFRLFGNIFAGEVLLAVIGSLIPIGAPIPFLFLEVMVGVIQALVFSMLSIVFMSMATQSHGDDH
jgi:F-type H+-transporting ATPase subunit a